MKQTLNILSAIVLLIGFSTANAGQHVDGFVDIKIGSNGSSTLRATMNVRHNNDRDVADSYLATSYSTAKGYISIHANDGVNSFVCYVSSSDANFSFAEKIHFGLGNGGFISVGRAAGSSTCVNFSLTSSSVYMD